MAGTEGSNPFRPTLFLSSDPLSLEVSNEAPLVSRGILTRLDLEAPAASEFCNAASINCNASREKDSKYWLEFRNFLLQRMNEILP
jgi:hypothetical protein